MTDATEYSPKPGSLPWRILTWLRANPEEELTRRDIAVKFDCQASTVDATLSAAVGWEAVKRSRNSEMEVVWSLGRNRSFALGQPDPLEGAPSDIVKPSAAPVHASAVAVVVDLAAIPVRKGVRLLTPEQQRRAEFMTWFDQFDVGDSAEFDDLHLATIRTESKRHAKATKRAYKIAATGPGRAGVERTA